MKFFLIGIKGTGMSALALCLKDMGEMVIGSDNENFYFTEEKLNSKKIPIFKFNKNNINKYKNYTFIISYAYNENNNEEVKEIFNNNYKYFYYGEFINTFFDCTKIGVSGTHGKTTTTSLLKTLFKNENISYIIGDGNGKGKKNTKYLIFEACEYKQHFLNYDYDYLIINNIDYDHPDYYNNIDEVIIAFKNVSKKAKNIIVNNDDENSSHLKHQNKYTFGIKNKSFVTGRILKKSKEGYRIKVNVRDEEYYFNLPFFGEYMIYNFLGAFTVYYLIHIQKNKKIENINNLLKEYENPKRRKEIIILENKNIIIDDYAHHPTEIEQTYNSIKEQYSDYEVTIVFQPHTYTRTIFLYKQFQEVFKNKEVYIMNTYRAREEQDIMKERIIDNIFINQKRYDIEEIKRKINKEKQVIIFMGAGNINCEITKLV